MDNNFLPKWLVSSLGGLLIALVALMVVQKAHDVNQDFSNTKAANTIAVSGQGKVTATPNLATVTIGVLSQGSSASQVSSQNNIKVNQVIAFVKKQGIADADIMTSEISLSLQQNYNGNTPTITGYQGEQTITVKVHNVDQSQNTLDTILDGAVSNGANEIDGVDLSIEDPSSLQEQAQEMAISDAKAKAQKLAQAAGLTLGKVVDVSESGTPIIPQPLPFAANSMALGAGSSAAVAPSIQTGSQEIDETMTVTFEVK